VTKTEVKQSTGTRQACKPQAKRVPHNLTTRVRRTLRQSAPTEEVSSASTEKPTTTREGPTGPVEGAYHKKSWLRTLVVLGDQNRSQIIDRHASGLQAPGETRATQPDNAREAYPQIKRTHRRGLFRLYGKTHNDTRGAYGPRGRRVPQKELASHPRGTRRPKSKPNNLTTRVRPTSLRQCAPH
jgi:hypothetical protein